MDKYEQVLTSKHMYRGRAKAWALNSTVSIHRDHTQSHRLLFAREKPRGPSLTQRMTSYNLKQGRRGTRGSPFWISGSLSLASLADAAGHSSDESCPLPAAVL